MTVIAESLPATCLLLFEDVARELSASTAQAYALVRSGELPAITVGGRGQMEDRRTKLEAFIAKAYTGTATWVDEHPFGNEEP